MEEQRSSTEIEEGLSSLREQEDAVESKDNEKVEAFLALSADCEKMIETLKPYLEGTYQQASSTAQVQDTQPSTEKNSHEYSRITQGDSPQLSIPIEESEKNILGDNPHNGICSPYRETVPVQATQEAPCTDLSIKTRSGNKNNRSDSKEFKSRYHEDFEQLYCLGKGGYGTVFAARNKLDENTYAIKRILLPNREEARQKVMREVKAMAKLEHHNIVRYFQAWFESPTVEQKDYHNCAIDQTFSSTYSSTIETSSNLNSADDEKEESCSSSVEFRDDSGSMDVPSKNHSNDQRENKETAGGHKKYLYIQMQLCKRETLGDWLNGKRNDQQVLVIFEQIISAVQYIHKCAMIHRDLKPSNIFFSLDGFIKIGDFGLVKEVHSASRMELPVAPEKKHTDQVGTELYMSPEQIARKSYDCKVDIFSSGLIFVELMHPFSTQMERIQVLESAKQRIFPEGFRQSSKKVQFAEWLLAEADKRPSADEIVESELYRENIAIKK